MDDAARINTFKQLLRVKFRAGSASPDLVGLRKYISDLEAEASGSVIINSGSFEGEQATGQVILEPLVKVAAALDVLAEIDPSAPQPPATIRYADFSDGYIE